MTKLDKLIEKLKIQIDENNNELTSLKNPKGLLLALTDLSNIVGMDNLKESIADQTNFLIMKQKEGKREKSMLNTILYGPPGVGKTSVGVILARIWYNLGYLDYYKKEGILNGVTEVISNNKNDELIIAFIYLTIISISLIISGIKWCYNNLNFIMVLFFIIFMTLITFILYFYVKYNNEDINKEKIIRCNETGDDCYEIETVYTEDDIIEITSRSDFIDFYVGWTAPKTEKLLKSNRGKVVFIDEAYSLCTDPRDSFGIEALTALNKFLSEHPNEIVVIFAGYKELMQDGIFKVQPGLPRRCMWHFECDTYDGDELTEIFKRQLNKSGLQIENEKNVRKIIKDNIDAFPSYGGDTERLVFYSQIHHSGDKNAKIGILSTNDVKSGIKRLRENNIIKDGNNKIEQYDDSCIPNPAMDMFRQMFENYTRQNNNRNEYNRNEYNTVMLEEKDQSHNKLLKDITRLAT